MSEMQNEETAPAKTKAKHWLAPGTEIGKIECIVCGDEIILTRRRPKARFCTPRCRTAHWNATHPRIGTTQIEDFESRIAFLIEPRLKDSLPFLTDSDSARISVEIAKVISEDLSAIEQENAPSASDVG